MLGRFFRSLAVLDYLPRTPNHCNPISPGLALPSEDNKATPRDNDRKAHQGKGVSVRPTCVGLTLTYLLTHKGICLNRLETPKQKRQHPRAAPSNYREAV